MTLPYVAIIYIVGVVVGATWLQTTPAGWLWLLPVALLSLAPFLNRLHAEPEVPLRWEREFGFRTPRTRITYALIGACALALVAGVLRIGGDPLYPAFSADSLAVHNVPAEDSFNVKEGWQVVEGYVASHVAQTPARQRITIAAQRLVNFGNAHPVSGNVTLLLDSDRGLHYGDAVRVAGVLSTPPEFADFSWRDWLARRNIHSAMNLAQVTPMEGEPQGNAFLRQVYALRSRGEDVINALLPEPHASLANGMLLGIDANIPDALMQEFNDTSASHVIVISGSNIALIAGVLMAAGARFGKRNRWVVGITLAGIGIYAVLVGAEPSVVRAAIMGGMLVIATALGRQSTAVVSLAAAALAMVIVDPHILWDVGFQLSAVATLGLILLVPALRPSVPGLRPSVPGLRPSVPGLRPSAAASHNEALASAINPLRSVRAFLVDTIAVSLAATLAVTPLLIWHFQRLSLIGLITNLLIVPIQPLILISGLGGLIVGMVGLLPIARLFFAPTWLGLIWTTGVVERSAQVRWANLAVGGSAALVLCALCVVLGVLLWQRRPQGESSASDAVTATRIRWQKLAASPIPTGAMVMIAALAWLGVAARADGMTHVWFLPAERGQAVLIQSPSGRQILVDGGDDGARLLSTLGSTMGFWDRSLDYLLLTSDDERTTETQVTLAKRLRIGGALTALPLQETVATWARTLAEQGIAANTVAIGSVIEIEDGLSLTLLADATNPADPGVVEVRYGNLRLLLPGSTQTAPHLLTGDATAITVPDLGRADAATLLQGASPEMVIIYSDDTLSSAAGLAVRYPNVERTLHLWSDGNQLWVSD